MSSIGRKFPATLWGYNRGPNGLTSVLTTKEPAPAELLKLISCKCEKGCGRACGCRKAGLKCSEICDSCHGQTCTNVKQLEVDEMDNDETDTVQRRSIDAENDELGELQDVYLGADDNEAELDEEATRDTPTNLDSLEKSVSPGPSTSKRRRILGDENVV